MSTLGPNLPHLVTDPDASTVLPSACGVVTARRRLGFSSGPPASQFVVAVVDEPDSEAAAMARKCQDLKGVELQTRTRSEDAVSMPRHFRRCPVLGTQAAVLRVLSESSSLDMEGGH